MIGNGPYLGRIELLVENDDGGRFLQSQNGQILEFSGPDQQSRICFASLLHNGSDDFYTTGQGQFAEFRHGFLGPTSGFR